MIRFIIFYSALFSYISAEVGCTDPEAFNCIDDQDYHTYIIDAAGIMYDNSCNWSYDFSDSIYVDENNCDFLNIPNDNDFSCTGYYNPQATEDDGSCRYPQAPSEEDITFTILSDTEINIDWSSFSTPDNAVFESYHIQRCSEESCSWVEGASNFDAYSDMSIIDVIDWEIGSPLKYLFAVSYANNTYWGQAIDYTYLTPTEGCIDPEASNFDPEANVDDGSCILLTLDSKIINNFKLGKVYPNPFNSSVTIEYYMKNFGYVTMDIVDINGKIIDRLIDYTISSGNHKFIWNASDFSSGIYFIQINSLQTNSYQYKKIVYLK